MIPSRLSALYRFALAKLSRTTSSGNYIPEIDGLRCLAIAGVIAFHLAGFVKEKSPVSFTPSAFDDCFFRVLRTGHIGVQLFFIISGLVVSLPFATHHLLGGKPVNLRRYFLRRLTRIEPPYVIALIFWLLAFGVSGLGEAPFPVLLRHFPASLFYLHNLIYQQPSYVLPPAWSLEIEVQFYLLAPLLCYVYCIRSKTIRRAILLFAVLVIGFAQRWLRDPGQLNGLHLNQELHYFLAGLLLSDLYILDWRTSLPAKPMMGDFTALLALLTLPVVLIQFPDMQPGVVLLLLIFTVGAVRSRYFKSVLQIPVVYTFGGMCYTTYLYHGFFKALPGHFTVRWQIGHHFWLNFLLQAALLIPTIIAGSVVLFVLTERPFMKGRSPKK